MLMINPGAMREIITIQKNTSEKDLREIPLTTGMIIMPVTPTSMS